MVMEYFTGPVAPTQEYAGLTVRMPCRWYRLPAALAKIRSPGVAFSMTIVGGGFVTSGGRATSLTLSTQKMALPVSPGACPDHILRTMPVTVSILGAVGLIGKTMCIQPGLVETEKPGSQFWLKSWLRNPGSMKPKSPAGRCGELGSHNKSKTRLVYCEPSTS